MNQDCDSGNKIWAYNLNQDLFYFELKNFDYFFNQNSVWPLKCIVRFDFKIKISFDLKDRDTGTSSFQKKSVFDFHYTTLY